MTPTCAECGGPVTDAHRFYEPDMAGREVMVAHYCATCCPRCFRKERAS